MSRSRTTKRCIEQAIEPQEQRKEQTVGKRYFVVIGGAIWYNFNVVVSEKSESMEESNNFRIIDKKMEKGNTQYDFLETVSSLLFV